MSGTDLIAGAQLLRQVLPKNVTPLHYDLELELDWSTFTFRGIVKIELDVVAETRTFTLNARDLEIHSCSVWTEDVEVTSRPQITFDTALQRVTFDIDDGKAIAAGAKAQLRISFTGQLNDKMNGFYRSSYIDSEGQLGFIAATQMESAECRQAFPCWDEPALKATFTVSLISDHAHTCLSNMDVASESEIVSAITGTKRKVVRFNKSPPMSTYLIAFVVGELKCLESQVSRIPIRAFVTPDQDLEQARFMLDLTARTLEFYEKSFDVEYPLPKLDMAVIPDFYSGGMENWGLILYDGDNLVDQGHSGISFKQLAADTVQHEVAHQWFGNLVTMEWWDGLWLNEGFATWMALYSTSVLYPEWKPWQKFVSTEFQDILNSDALRASHPVEELVDRAEGIEEIFDGITYRKGASVLRMISTYLGEDVFLRGVSAYIKQYAFGITKTSDLWDVLNRCSGKPVQQIMDVWTKRVGYPLLKVTEAPESGAITITQNRFLETGDPQEADDDTLYPVMLGLKTKDGIRENLLLIERQITLEVDLDFYKLNADHKSICRVLYTPERLLKLGQAASTDMMSVEDRAGLISDAKALCSAGYQNLEDLFSILQTLKMDSEQNVWIQIADTLDAFHEAWAFEPLEVRQGLKRFHCSLLGPKLAELQWDFDEINCDESNDSLLQLKALLFGSALEAGDPQLVSFALARFQQLVNGNPDAIHPEILGAVYGAVVEQGSHESYQALLDRFQNSSDAEEKNAALQALGRCTHPELIDRSLSLCISDLVKPQDALFPIQGLSSSPQGVIERFDWMRNNWKALYEKFGSGQNMLDRVVTCCCEGLATTEQFTRAESFFEEQDLEGIHRTVRQSLERIKVRAGWVTRDRQAMQKFLKAFGIL